jgi:hypothetical protein
MWSSSPHQATPPRPFALLRHGSPGAGIVDLASLPGLAALTGGIAYNSRWIPTSR